MSGGVSTDFGFRIDSRGRLVLRRPDGTEVVGVMPVRAFPLSDPEGLVAFCDEGGREVGWVPRLERLPPGDRRLVEEEMERWEFLPVIRRIRSISPVDYPSLWEVETDRGPASFLVTADEHIRLVGKGGVLVADSHGIRWWVPDRKAMDRASRRWLSRIL
jgi:hypothetical protein